MARPTPSSRACAATMFVALACAALVPAAAAQSPEPQRDPVASATAGDRPERDYLFGQPRGAFGVRAGWLFASAGSDVFDFVTDQLTLDKSSFNAPNLAVEVDFAVTPRLDVVAGIESSYTTTDSEYRDFVDNSGLPIEQTTSLRQFSIVGSVRYALTPKGRRVSRYAWIPRTFVPYVGAGGGVMKYDFKQDGDFIDFVDMGVFTDRFQSEGWAPSFHAFGGADVRVFRSLYVTVEGRYTWATADLEPDFVDFEPIDLSGFRCTAGIRVGF